MTNWKPLTDVTRELFVFLTFRLDKYAYEYTLKRRSKYADPEFLKKFLNEQGKILPRRITGTSVKFQRKVATAVKRARHLALLPYVTDLMK